jgi:hypothetical protein
MYSHADKENKLNTGFLNVIDLVPMEVQEIPEAPLKTVKPKVQRKPKNPNDETVPKAPKRKRNNESPKKSVSLVTQNPKMVNVARKPTVDSKATEEELLLQYRMDLGGILTEQAELKAKEKRLRLLIKKLQRNVVIAQYDGGRFFDFRIFFPSQHLDNYYR